ncbi:hypothetical protein [Streptomyces bambusae]|uniref:Uncharacterized protein n=1 Tax=Streptomyces bambusae TaxID=1550616 RepID=A0ABS6YZQ3_9ACTN|nr:hypothetical protein [Streptomyces bambusae]MBW5480968.1 hypothetical protein [Streptomyces bambusae]
MSEPSNPLAHRTALTVPDGSATLPDVRRITGTWLNEKFHREIPIASGLHHLDGKRLLLSQVAYRADGTERAMRLQLREDLDEATWRTTVTAVADGGPGTGTGPGPGPAAVSVGLECFVNPGYAVEPARPRVVELLVAGLRCQDGPVRLTLAPIPTAAQDIGALIEVLCDPDRQRPVIVAAAPRHPEPVWWRGLDKAMRKAAGAASSYLLDDTAAVDAFRQAAEHHRVAPGAVRTFLPEVDPAWPADGPRHRYSTVARLTDPRSGSWNNIVRIVQRMSTEAALPAPLSTLVFPEEDQRRDDRRAALDTRAVSNEVDGLRRKVAELSALLEIADEEITELQNGEKLLQRTSASLDSDLRALRARADSDLEDHLQALEEVERARAEADMLRSRLARQGRLEETVIVDAPPGLPAGFEELWDRCGEFENIIVSALPAPALALDETDRARVWAGKTWTALRALDRYGRDAREGFKGGFYEHCQSEQSCWPVKKVTMVESDTTMSQYGTERHLPVPTQYAPSGRAEMQPHLKIDSKGESPRIHFLDDTKGSTGKVIVGYIGKHLTNTRTN